LHSKITRIKNYFQMHFKNYKSFELYILLNLIYLMSIPITSLQFIMHCGIDITRLSLTSISRSLRLMLDSGACADPTIIAAAAHPHLAPLAERSHSCATMTC
jgi:hypothetical protein